MQLQSTELSSLLSQQFRLPSHIFEGSVALKCKILIRFINSSKVNINIYSLEVGEAAANSGLVSHVLAVGLVVTKLVFGHAFEAGAALHLAGGTSLLQVPTSGFLLVAAIVTIGSAVADGSLGQAEPQRAAMSGALRS